MRVKWSGGAGALITRRRRTVRPMDAGDGRPGSSLPFHLILCGHFWTVTLRRGIVDCEIYFCRFGIFVWLITSWVLRTWSYIFFLTRLNVRWKIFLLVIYSLFLKRMLYRALLLIATGYIFQDEKTQGLQVQIHIFLISWLPYPSIKVAISQIDLISHGCHIHQLKLQLVKSI
jgi:hypothetical protein